MAPEKADAFEQAVNEARPLFLATPDCTSFRLDRVIEEPGTYLLVVGWTSVEAHMLTFRASEGFQRWRELAGPFLSEPPEVVHTAQTV
ncbi:putative quinol monooxygenase [Phaeovulum sp. W22_SRMD_FR3]|uniref:putative quinol monooxygenase n=1 Tax=Phaeovulum sp. W22_SRMD_FR3 TaxID=3240274 RepID=UPI003F9D0A1C